MPDIREVLKALSPEDKTLWSQVRNNMRSVYLNAHNSIVGIAAWDQTDDAFIDLIDIKLALLFDRGGRLDTTTDIVGTEHKEIEQDIYTAEDKMKAKPIVHASAGTAALIQNGWK